MANCSACIVINLTQSKVGCGLNILILRVLVNEKRESHCYGKRVLV